MDICPVPLNLSGNSVVGSAFQTHPVSGCFFVGGKMSNNSSKTKVLVEGALLIAISAVLSIWPKFKFLPYGGSITVCSMLPIILFSYRRGIKWGLLAGLAFALIQTITGFTSSGTGFVPFIFELLFDYLVAFTVLGLGGMFRGKLGSSKKEFVIGTVVAIMLRYLSHFISGYVVWGEYAEWFFGEVGPWGQNILNTMSGNALSAFYSLVYNGTYMIPELIITTIVAAIIFPYVDFKE